MSGPLEELRDWLASIRLASSGEIVLAIQPFGTVAPFTIRLDDLAALLAASGTGERPADSGSGPSLEELPEWAELVRWVNWREGVPLVQVYEAARALVLAASGMGERPTAALPPILDPLLDALNKLSAIPSGRDGRFENATYDVLGIFGKLPDRLVGPKRNNHRPTPPDAGTGTPSDDGRWAVWVEGPITDPAHLAAFPQGTVAVDDVGALRQHRYGNTHMAGGWTSHGNNPLSTSELVENGRRPVWVIHVAPAPPSTGAESRDDR